MSPRTGGYIHLKLVNRDGRVHYGKVHSRGTVWIRVFDPALGDSDWVFENGIIAGLGQCDNAHSHAAIQNTTLAEYAAAEADVKQNGDKVAEFAEKMQTFEREQEAESRRDRAELDREIMNPKPAPRPTFWDRLSKSWRVLQGND